MRKVQRLMNKRNAGGSSRPHLTEDEYRKMMWIRELEGYGVNEGPKGEKLEGMGYYEIRNLLVKTQMQQDTDIDVTAKANAFF